MPEPESMMHGFPRPRPRTGVLKPGETIDSLRQEAALRTPETPEKIQDRIAALKGHFDACDNFQEAASYAVEIVQLQARLKHAEISDDAKARLKTIIDIGAPGE